MQLIIDYIIANWNWLLPVVLSVVEFLILFIFRRNIKVGKYELYTSGLFESLPVYIKQAEDKFGSGHGKEKMDYVLSCYKMAHPNPLFILIEPAIRQTIESILSCPQKKGGE